MRRGRTFWWSLFALGSVVILAFVPYANAVQRPVRDALGPQGLRWGLAGIVVLAATAVIVALIRRRRELSLALLARALAVPALTVVGMVQLDVVAEAFHLVEYGLLGAVAYRALSFDLRGAGVFVAAAALTSLVGLGDEIVQWVTPGRFWGLRDVGLNVAGAVLVQVWIASLRPAGLGSSPARPEAKGSTIQAPGT